MRTFGTITLAPSGTAFIIECEPHVSGRIKAVFPKLDKTQHGKILLSAGRSNCRDMEWFIQRYPLRMDDQTAFFIREQSKSYQKNLEELEAIVLPGFEPRAFGSMALPPRTYQASAVEVYLKARALLIADQMGLGKTVCAIASFTQPETRPALVVCQTHLAIQWRDEFLSKFLPQAKVHIIKTGKPYPLPKADVYLMSYHKMAGWADTFVNRPFFKSIVFDECQELRHEGTAKYRAAQAIRNGCQFAMGLSGTPIYNYGGEIFRVMEILAPGKLGTWSEFSREWCKPYGDKTILTSPRAFGGWMRENFLMVRRERHEVGLQLPASQKIVQEIPYDPQILDGIKNHATELAKLILTGSFTQSGQSARELDLLLRQKTGIAKAPFVAEFVRMLLADGCASVLMFGWHREVYDIWLDALKEFNPVMFTGSETPKQKDASKQAFIEGRSKVMIMSLRAGQGVDGLQRACTTAVFGELDWSPGVHAQCEARIDRGETTGIISYYMVADGGSDPVIAQLLGLKNSQVQGLLASKDAQIEELTQVDPERIKEMARAYLERNK